MAASAPSGHNLRLDAVSKRFGPAGAGGVLALDALSLEVPAGEFVALLGPSGCGKSTALGCVAGLVRPSSGHIWMGDRCIDQVPPERRGFALVFQSFALFPHMTVARNVAFGLTLRGLPAAEIETRVGRALASVHLGGVADRYPATLSGGQQQRVALARAIVVEPQLLLMDEPLSNLDTTLRLELRAEIRRLHRELGRATLYVTHDQDEALSLADRVVVMGAGRAIQIASPQEIYTRPATVAVAQFLGYRNVITMEVAGAVAGAEVRVRRRDVTLVGTAMGAVSAGAVSVAIRPEELSIVDGTAPNAWPGVVTGAEYQGSDWLLEIVASGDVSLFVRSASFVSVGTTLHVAAAPGRVLVYPSPIPSPSQ